MVLEVRDLSGDPWEITIAVESGWGRSIHLFYSIGIQVPGWPPTERTQSPGGRAYFGPRPSPLLEHHLQVLHGHTGLPDQCSGGWGDLGLSDHICSLLWRPPLEDGGLRCRLGGTRVSLVTAAGCWGRGLGRCRTLWYRPMIGTGLGSGAQPGGRGHRLFLQQGLLPTLL